MNVPSNCYSVLKVSELKQNLAWESRTILNFDEMLSTNLAFIYYLKSGEVLLIPNDRNDSSEGIKFENKECYRSCLHNDSFPVKNPNNTVYEKFQPEITNVKSQIINMIDELIQTFNLSCKSSDDIENISDLLISMKKRAKEISLKHKLYFSLLLGEYIRKVNNGEWILIKKYGKYNPYYIPAILYSKNKQILLILDYFNTYYEDKNLTPQDYVNLPYVKEPGFNLQDLKFVKYQNPYKIL